MTTSKSNMRVQYNGRYAAYLSNVAKRRPLTEYDLFAAHLAAASFVGIAAPRFALDGANEAIRWIGHDRRLAIADPFYMASRPAAAYAPCASDKTHALFLAIAALDVRGMTI